MTTNKTKIKIMRYYIYVYLDVSKPGTYEYETSNQKYLFNYEPVYVGKGCGDIHKCHEVESHNIGLNNFINSKEWECKIVTDELPSHFAYKVESELIFKIGRKDLGNGPLYNKSAGIKLYEAKRLSHIGPLHMEMNRVLHVLKVLNQSITIKEAADILGISERTLYRFLKQYKIVKDKATKEFHQQL